MNTDESKDTIEEKENIKPQENANETSPEVDDTPVRDMVILHTLILIIVAAVTLTGIIIAAVNVLSMIKEDKMFYDYFSNQTIVYEKNDGVYLHNLDNLKTHELSGNTCKKAISSADKKKMFILSGNELIYLNFNKINYDVSSSLMKIDDNVTTFDASKNGRVVAYLKNSGLYTSVSGKEPFLVCEQSTDDFSISSQGTSIIYRTSDGALGIFDTNKNKDFRIPDVSDFEIDAKSKTLYYISENKLFYCTKDKQFVELNDNTSDIFSLNSMVYALIHRSDYSSLYSVSQKGLHLIETKISAPPELNDNFFVYKRITQYGTETRVITEKNLNFNMFDSGSDARDITLTNTNTALYALMQYRESASSLMEFQLNKNGINERNVLSDNAYNYTLLANNSIIYADIYGTHLYSNGKSQLITPYQLKNIVCISNTIYATECIDENYFRLLRIKNNSVQPLDENIAADFYALSSTDVLYLKNGALYYKHDNEQSIVIDNYVKNIIKHEKTD